jgi:uncharacterized membrane protein YkvA (DUF1232 family)
MRARKQKTIPVGSQSGLWPGLIRSARLAWRLMRDPRVATTTKLLVPALAAAYVLFPVDLLPDLVPLLGQVDDLVILALAVRLFIELCPPAVVREHLAALRGHDSQPGHDEAGGEVLDGEYRVIE